MLSQCFETSETQYVLHCFVFFLVSMGSLLTIRAFEIRFFQAIHPTDFLPRTSWLRTIARCRFRCYRREKKQLGVVADLAAFTTAPVSTLAMLSACVFLWYMECLTGLPRAVGTSCQPPGAGLGPWSETLLSTGVAERHDDVAYGRFAFPVGTLCQPPRQVLSMRSETVSPCCQALDHAAATRMCRSWR